MKITPQELRTLCIAWGKYHEQWITRAARDMRARTVANVLGGKAALGASDFGVRECHNTIAELVKLYQEFDDPNDIESDDPLFPVVVDFERFVGRWLVTILTGNKCESRLSALSKLNGKFPVSREVPVLDFYEGRFHEFQPTLQDGLKPVVLRAFLDLHLTITASSLPYAHLRLPTISELTSTIREKWKWKGDDRELRDARRDLGLGGLPRAKSGRPPKKKRGKK